MLQVHYQLMTLFCQPCLPYQLSFFPYITFVILPDNRLPCQYVGLVNLPTLAFIQLVNMSTCGGK